jgi:hypothetical protein
MTAAMAQHQQESTGTSTACKMKISATHAEPSADAGKPCTAALGWHKPHKVLCFVVDVADLWGSAA